MKSSHKFIQKFWLLSEQIIELIRSSPEKNNGNLDQTTDKDLVDTSDDDNKSKKNQKTQVEIN